MKQTKINFQKTRESVEEANLRSARIILQNPEKYAGIAVEWATLVVDRAEPKGPQIGERCE